MAKKHSGETPSAYAWRIIGESKEIKRIRVREKREKKEFDEFAWNFGHAKIVTPKKKKPKKRKKSKPKIKDVPNLPDAIHQDKRIVE